jgi:hypothetical protein
MIISCVNIVVVTLQKFAFHQHYNAIITNGCFYYETNEVTKEKFGWIY